MVGGDAGQKKVTEDPGKKGESPASTSTGKKAEEERKDEPKGGDEKGEDEAGADAQDDNGEK